MSNKTKRNVFGQLLNAYQNLISKGIEIHDENYRENITTPWNIVYDAALPDETEKQKKCPYCHNKCGLKISQDAYSFWYRNKRFKPLFCSNCGRKL